MWVRVVFHLMILIKHSREINTGSKCKNKIRWSTYSWYILPDRIINLFRCGLAGLFNKVSDPLWNSWVSLSFDSLYHRIKCLPILTSTPSLFTRKPRKRISRILWGARAHPWILSLVDQAKPSSLASSARVWLYIICEWSRLLSHTAGSEGTL